MITEFEENIIIEGEEPEIDKKLNFLDVNKKMLNANSYLMNNNNSGIFPYENS